jgi:Spy/CpxP family protein refolding chaperone
MNNVVTNTLKLGLFLAMTFGTAARADDFDQLKATTPSQRAAAQTEYMKSHLGLTDAQMPKITAINQKYAEQMEPVIKSADGGLGKMLKAKAIQDNKDAELQQTLTPDQFERFVSSKDEMREAVKRALLKD